MYSFEVVGSVVLTFHGLIGLRSAEHPKSIGGMKVLSVYSKIAFVTYVVCVIARSIIWYYVITNVVDLSKETINFGSLYGDFLAVFVDNS